MKFSPVTVFVEILCQRPLCPRGHLAAKYGANWGLSSCSIRASSRTTSSRGTLDISFFVMNQATGFRSLPIILIPSLAPSTTVVPPPMKISATETSLKHPFR